jgi:hypothetical protein
MGGSAIEVDTKPGREYLSGFFRRRFESNIHPKPISSDNFACNAQMLLAGVQSLPTLVPKSGDFGLRLQQFLYTCFASNPVLCLIFRYNSANSSIL